MMFSIVTISFNQAEFLERTILSVIGQTGVEVEYIVVDPGSTDGSREIIDRYKERISHVVYERDGGPADGLNRGFALASGDIYCYLNSDDTLAPDALLRVAQFFARRPEFDVVCGHAWVTDRFDNRLRRVWSEPYRRRSVAYGAAVQIQPSTFVRRAAYLKTSGFNVENTSSWDAELLLDLYLSGSRIGIINAFLSTYRLHSVSITNSGRMLALAQQASDARFRRLMGRSKRPFDIAVATALRLGKHLRKPSACWERIMKGPVFNRGVQ